MRLILTLLLMAFTAPVWAEWVKYGESEYRTNYYDPATIKESGDVRSVWEIHDLKQREDDGVLSLRGLSEYDCKNRRMRFLSSSGHSERMGGGRTLDIDSTATRWIYLPPDVVGTALLRILCK